MYIDAYAFNYVCVYLSDVCILLILPFPPTLSLFCILSIPNFLSFHMLYLFIFSLLT